ncbi:MAG: selenocysteine-specific translation elongation factor [Gemmatimonadota bacterium]|nr:MAG: selenocysteine-specific translation elongation factor [Gemmatimonadota bacterium]
MRSIIVGTAGHVDLGKTALIEALTGVNTDRWEEERRRGITIDLGFANFPTGDDELEISVVDVPGHEDFVKNMLAGASGVDVLLLVIAADEGPMPQTREHLSIARLLGVSQGVIALSKADLVDEEWCELVKESLADELGRGLALDDWTVVTVSAATRVGLEELSSAILRAARSVPARNTEDLLRIPVDRAFTVRGVGTVVTGTIWSGSVTSGSEVYILPGDRRVRVRGIQVHGRDVQTGRAGQRAALALAGVDRSEVGRGCLLTSDRAWRATRFLDAELQLLPNSPWPLRHWQRVRFHLGTAETLARVVLYDSGPLQPGRSTLVQLRLEEPVVARTGDRFVVRFYSPVTTIGGGLVVDPWARRRSRLPAADARDLAARAAASPEERLQRLVVACADGSTDTELTIRAGASPARVRDELRRLTDEGLIHQVEDRWFSVRALGEARDAVLDLLEAGHARDSGAEGVSLETLRNAAGKPASLVNAALAELQMEGRIRVQGSVAALSSHQPRLQPEQQKLAGAALGRLRQAALAPPGIKELAAELGAPEDRILAVLKFLAQRGDLVPVTADLYFHSGAISELRVQVCELLSGGAVASPSEFRTALGVSRKYLIPLLEYLDAAGVTRRTEQGRVLRNGS